MGTWPRWGWIVVLAFAAAAWLLVSEVGGWGAAPVDRGGDEPDGMRSVLEDGSLAEDLQRTARLRGLPGIRTRTEGVGRLHGAVHLNVPELGPRPLAGVRVNLLGSVGAHTIPRATETGDDGSFVFEDLPAPVGYAVVVRHPGYREVVLRGLYVSPDHTTDAGTVLIGAPTVLIGEVTDGAGHPVGATVQVFRDTSRPQRLDLRQGLQDLQAAVDPLAEAVSGRDGRFAVQDLPPGRYVLRIEAPGYATQFREGVWVTTDERASAVRVILDPGAGYHGRVLDESGRAVAGARVIAIAMPGTQLQRLDRVETRTDASGRYHLDRLVPGLRYFLEAWAEGFAPTGRILVPESMESLDLVLGRSGRVEGTVADASTGQPLVGAEITLVAGAVNTLSPLAAFTDAQGRYAFANVNPGPILLYAATADGYETASFDLVGSGGRMVKAGETLVIDQELKRGAVVRGRVQEPSGAPVAYATVAFANRRRRMEGERTALTAADGSYEISGLAPATYEIRVSAAGYAPLTDEALAQIEILEGEAERLQDLVIDRGGLLVGVVRSPTGAAVAGARVEVLAEGDRAVRERVRDLVAVTSAAGTYRIVGVPPMMALRARADHDAWAPATAAFRVGSGRETTLDLTLGAGLRLTGVVTDGRGRPVEDARIRWGPVGPDDERRLRDAFRADELLGPRVVRSDASGAFLLEHLEPGRLLLKVEHGSFADWYRKDLVLHEGADPPALEVVLEAGALVEGRVVDASTRRPVADAWVYARAQQDADADPGRVRPLVSTQTGADGRYALEGLPTGRYEIVVWLALGYRTAAQHRDEESARRREIEPGTAGVDFALVRDEGE